MTIDNVMLTVNRVPEIVLSTGTDWVAILSSMAAIVAVVAGTVYNSKSFKKTVISQEKIAQDNVEFQKEQSRSEFLAKSRLEWIAIFREQVAHFLSLGHNVYNVSEYIVNSDWVTGDTLEEFKKSKELYEIRYAEYTDKLAKARLHFAQLELLLSPNDTNSPLLISAMNSYLDLASQNGRIIDKGQEVVEITQAILRREWVKVKAMESL
ncbi:hypothetical protein [Pseudomonas palleroniana]|uniref:hypothetical protein n=1 Tax=Pseudomonas palleroniana TaxID=191390 RepID=UPI0018E6CB1E|nr:hypothetical protein [Pseudomonas palleroniana]MBI6911087.1 hypothetical protein [Pseudomonas palleroniana]